MSSSGFVAFALIMANAQPASQQELYKATAAGWTVYRESKSCVAYADFPSGTMLRLSNRTDEGRMYVNLINEGWEHLRPIAGQSVTLTLHFPRLRRNHGTAAGIIESPDGRMGYAGADLASGALLLALASGAELVVEVMFESASSTVEVERITLAGGDEAALHLQECSERHFP